MTEGELFEHLRARAARCGRAALGIMGGTFDPVHLGHTALADAVMGTLGLDGMLYVPAGLPAFKLDRACAPAADRLAMVRLAVGERPACAVSARELERAGTTYTVDTLRELAGELPEGVRLVFAAGADALETLPLWHEAAALARLAEFAVVPRVGYDVRAALTAVERADLGFTVRVVRAGLPEVSSTLVRARCAAGESLAGLVEPKVAAYIRARGLYGMR